MAGQYRSGEVAMRGACTARHSNESSALINVPVFKVSQTVDRQRTAQLVPLAETFVSQRRDTGGHIGEL